MPFWLWKPRRHSRSRAKSRFPKCLRAPRAGAFLSAGRKNFNSLPEKFVVRVDKSCQGEYNKRNITKMAVKRRVGLRIDPYQKARAMEKGGKQEAENGLGAARTTSKSTSPRRVRPLKRPAVSRKSFCRSFEAASVRMLRTKVVPRKFQASVLVQRRADRDGGFFRASGQSWRGLCRAAVHFIQTIEREQNYDYSS